MSDRNNPYGLMVLDDGTVRLHPSLEPADGPAEAPEPDLCDPGNDPPRVLLVTPHYGGLSRDWHYTVNHAVKDRRRVRLVKEAQSSSSVLPHAFNELFALALDMRDAGEITHMAMAHSDIGAEWGWLDTLCAEMWWHRADLISAVVPIKTEHGRTSTAVGIEGDRWAVKRCVWLRERATLPETFGPEHVCKPGEVLLVNTGLMLLDLRRGWWDDFAFQFACRIDKPPAGKRAARHRSEDWEMSHHLHDAGARVMATWKVRLNHEGGGKWSNRVGAAPPG